MLPIIAALGALIPGVGTLIGTAAAASIAVNAVNNFKSAENASNESKKTKNDYMELMTIPTSLSKDECTVSEAAEFLGLSEYTIKRKIREGALRGRIAGKKYMVSKKSIEEYAEEVGKSGQILGTYSSDGGFSKAWEDIDSVKAFEEQTKIQQEILSVECKKLELEKKIASKNNDEDKVNEISKQIMDKTIQSLQCTRALKLCEAQILYLEKIEDMPKDE